MEPLLIKLFLIHAVYSRSEICYLDLINKLKIELLKRSICFDNEAASTSLKQQVARSSRRSVAPVQWSLSVLCPKIKTPRGAHISYIIQRK